MASHTQPVVIVGGGFAGLRAALTLDKLLGRSIDTPIFLLDPSPEHLFTPTLYHLMSEDLPRVVTLPYAEILENTRIHFIQEPVTRVDLELRHVYTPHRRFEYSDLILAVGNQTRRIATRNEFKRDALACEIVDDTISFRNQLRHCLEDARAHRHRPCQVHCIIVGGGASGIEFAAGLQHFIQREAHRYGVSPRGIHITIFERQASILPRFPHSIRSQVETFLKQQGISVATSMQVTWPMLERFHRHGQSMHKNVIWAVGAQPNSLVRSTRGLRHDSQGKVLVDGSLQAIDHERVWVVGDAASVIDSGAPQSALAHGTHVARAIQLARNGTLAPAYKPQEFPLLLQLSPVYGIASIEGHLLDGLSVLWYKRYNDFRYLASLLPLNEALKFWITRGRVVSENEPVCSPEAWTKGIVS